MGNRGKNANLFGADMLQIRVFGLMIVTMRLFGLLLVCLLAAGPLYAGEHLPEEPGLDGIYAGMDPLPARELLAVEDFKEYTRLLAELKCNEALFILLNGFGSVYSDRPPPLSTPQLAFSWYLDVGKRLYPEVIFCLNVRDIRDGQAQISQLNLVVDRFEGCLTGPDMPEPAKNRNYGVVKLLEQAKEFYPPAYLELARLSAEGEIVRFSPVYQYFLVQRAKALGMQSDELDKLILETRLLLTPDELSAFESVDHWAQLSENGPIYE